MHIEMADIDQVIYEKKILGFAPVISNAVKNMKISGAFHTKHLFLKQKFCFSSNLEQTFHM